ncbi:MAG: hypothetical protein V4714_08490 [Bacteroidota bacterium]
MEARLIVRKEDIAKHKLEEQIFQLAKVIREEPSTWVLIPAENMQTLMLLLEEKHISYGIESEQEFIRGHVR